MLDKISENDLDFVEFADAVCIDWTLSDTNLIKLREDLSKPVIITYDSTFDRPDEVEEYLCTCLFFRATRSLEETSKLASLSTTKRKLQGIGRLRTAIFTK